MTSLSPPLLLLLLLLLLLRVARLMASIITVPPPPLVDTDPTSSLSNKAMARAPLCFFKDESFEASMSAFKAQKEEHKLSSLPLNMNSFVAPPI